jgi:hypothetical protein
MAAEHPLRGPGHRVVRRFARALGVGALIAAASAAAPAAADAAGVLVRVSGAERHVSPEGIGAAVDRPAGAYLLRASPTTAEPVAHPPALSVRRLVMLAGASPEAVSFASIERPNGAQALLGRGDLADPPPFAEGPPIAWMDAGGARYLKLTDLLTQSDVTVVRSGARDQTVIVKRGDRVQTLRVDPYRRVVGRGSRVGSLYRLSDGRLVYVQGR